jgi:hypothetical protein
MQMKTIDSPSESGIAHFGNFLSLLDFVSTIDQIDPIVSVNRYQSIGMADVYVMPKPRIFPTRLFSVPA